MIASAPKPDADPADTRLLRPMVVAIGAGLAWWVLRRGSVLRREFRLGPEGLTVSIGRHRRTLEYRDVAGVEARIPFEGRMQWVAVVSVTDVFEKSWEVPIALRRGPEWLDGLLERCGREDLAVWAEARGVRRRMERSGWFVIGGYVVAGGLLVGSVLVHLR